MTSINLPDSSAILKTAETYAKDLGERVASTFVVSAGGVLVAAGPADMFHASFWESVGVAGIAAAFSLVKGIIARARGVKDSASLAKGV